MKTSGYIRTFSGKKVVVLDPKPDSIVIEDIAHALSYTCRYGGHSTKFYSVAEHSVYISQFVDIEFAKEGLLHDASEAYIGDMVRPLKHSGKMGAFIEAEDNLTRVIAKKFGIQSEMSPEVKIADNNLLITEMSQIIPKANLNHPAISSYEILDLKIQCLQPEKAEQLFLYSFYQLFPNWR